MDLPQWWKSAKPDERQQLARVSGYQLAYLKKQACISRNNSDSIPEKMALRLCLASKEVTPERELTFEALCPELSSKYKTLFSGKAL